VTAEPEAFQHDADRRGGAGADDDGEEFDQFDGDRGYVDHTGPGWPRSITLSGAGPRNIRPSETTKRTVAPT